MSAPPTPARDRHPFLTYDMIQEIPESLEATLRGVRPVAEELAPTLEGRAPLVLTGSGTALFAALLGSQPLRLAAPPLPHYVLPAFEAARYDLPLGDRGALVAVSHSGVTKATVDAVRRARGAGARCVGVTHFEGRPLQEAAHEVLRAGNGPDRSKCHTKCYLAGALATAFLVHALLRARGAAGPRLASLEEEMAALPALARRTLASLDARCQELARRHLSRRVLCFAGAGPNVPTVREAALKVRETSYLPATGWATEEVLHGPWNAWDGETLVAVVAPTGPGTERAGDVVRAARIVGAATVAVVTEGDGGPAAEADHVLEIPAGDEYLSPYLAVLPLYLMAYHGAVARGHNPDELRYLSPPHWEARNVIFPPGTH